MKEIRPQFNALAGEGTRALTADDYGAGNAIIRKMASLSVTLHDALEEDATLNLDQAKRFAQDSERTFRTILWIDIVLIGVGVMAATCISVYLSRAMMTPLRKAAS